MGKSEGGIGVNVTREHVVAWEDRWSAFKPYDGENGPTCLACGVAIGEQHQEGCDWERCPHCGEQSIVCGNCQRETAFDAFEPLIEFARRQLGMVV